MALVIDDERTTREVIQLAVARGFVVEPLGLAAAIERPVGAIAYAPSTPPDLEMAARLAPLAQAAAERRRPVVLLATFPPARGHKAEERAAALAYLRTHGVLLAPEPDVWFETAVLIGAFGAPPGPRCAVIAPPGGWLPAR